MVNFFKRAGRRSANGITLYAGLVFSGALIMDAGAAVDAAAQSSVSLTSPAGQWDLALEDTNRRCRIYFHGDAAPGVSLGDAHVLAMPAGCRRAMPILSNVVIWSRDNETFALGARDGGTVLRFARADTDKFQAKGPEGETYTLTALDAAARQQYAQASVPGSAPVVPTPGFQQPAAATPAPATPAAAAPAKPAVLDPPKAAAMSGRYAVLRDAGKDTGCMLTLDERARGPKGSNKAQLAPACRDQGIVIFDPAGWAVEKGKLVLTARKGHQARFLYQADGVWMKEGTEGKPLGFRKM